MPSITLTYLDVFDSLIPSYQVIPIGTLGDKRVAVRRGARSGRCRASGDAGTRRRRGPTAMRSAAARWRQIGRSVRVGRRRLGRPGVGVAWASAASVGSGCGGMRGSGKPGSAAAPASASASSPVRRAGGVASAPAGADDRHALPVRCSVACPMTRSPMRSPIAMADQQHDRADGQDERSETFGRIQHASRTQYAVRPSAAGRRRGRPRALCGRSACRSDAPRAVRRRPCRRAPCARETRPDVARPIVDGCTRKMRTAPSSSSNAIAPTSTGEVVTSSLTSRPA